MMMATATTTTVLIRAIVNKGIQCFFNWSREISPRSSPNRTSDCSPNPSTRISFCSYRNNSQTHLKLYNVTLRSLHSAIISIAFLSTTTIITLQFKFKFKLTTMMFTNTLTSFTKLILTLPPLQFLAILLLSYVMMKTTATRFLPIGLLLVLSLALLMVYSWTRRKSPRRSHTMHRKHISSSGTQLPPPPSTSTVEQHVSPCAVNRSSPASGSSTDVLNTDRKDGT